MSSLEPLFRPRSIAIVGASSDPARPGSRPLRLFDSLGTPGKVYPVNPSYGEMSGHLCYPRITDVPDEVDLAIVQVSRDRVVEAVGDCAEAKVKAICMLTAGFGEFDAQGAELERQVLEICREAGIRMLGPNCLGIVNFNHPFVAAQTDMFEAVEHRRGTVGLVAQSGAFGGALWVQGLHRGIGFSSFVSTGNETDIAAADVIEFYATDPDTSAVACYLEAVHDGARLVQALRRCRENSKPVVIVKVGVSDLGAKAVASHTGAAAGSDAVFEAAIRDTGAIRVVGPMEAIDVLYALQQSKTTDPVDGLVTLTPSGGYGVFVSDLADSAALAMPTPTPDLVELIHEIQPNATTLNPIDTTGLPPKNRTWPYNLFAEISEVLVTHPQYDTIMLITYVTPHLTRWAQAHDAVIALAGSSTKRVVVVGITSSETRARLEEAGALVFAEPRHAIDALAAIDGFYRGLAAGIPAPTSAAEPSLLEGAAALVRTVASEGRLALTEREGRTVLRSLGIAVVEERPVTSAEEAVTMADALGYPVVLKGTDPSITHKSELGLVVLGVTGAKEAAEAYAVLEERLRKASAIQPEILVQPQIEPYVECIVGIQNDPSFGPVVMFGAGGVLTDVLADHQLALCPVDETGARALIERARVASILAGVRGRPAADVTALANVISRLSHLAHQLSDAVESIDVNPVAVQTEGAGAVALDALVLLRPTR